MGKLLTLTLALLIPSVAAATPYQDQHGEWWDIPMPAWHWSLDGPDLSGQIEAFYLPQDEVIEICSEALGKMEDFGCALVWPDRCEIYITKELPEQTRDAVRSLGVDHLYH